MSFDIALQRFRGGDGAADGGDEALRVPGPLLGGPPDGDSGLVRTADGDAEVYGLGSDGLMFTHADGRLIWQVLVDVARTADYLIMPGPGYLGAPTCPCATLGEP
ncbi:hypothetical protein ACIBTV_30180 [Micromonospora sp. NPDC049366]|uniref:hypothetical protein n=1 Tax=Micromonospora sp. NPDC049366 TaxID=3364271 RepID=UPI0037ABECD1